MPRGTDDYIEFIEQILETDYQVNIAQDEIRRSVLEEGLTFDELITFFTEEYIDPDDVDPALVENLGNILKQLGGGLTDSRFVIIPKETDKLYIPPSGYCLIHCLAKAAEIMEIPLEYEEIYKKVKNSKKMTAHGEVSTHVVGKIISMFPEFNNAYGPILGFTGYDSKRGNWRLRNGASNCSLRIAYVSFKDAGIECEKLPRHGHYVLFKQKMSPGKPHQLGIEIRQNNAFDLKKQKAYGGFTPKVVEDMIAIWDLETYQSDNGSFQSKKNITQVKRGESEEFKFKRFVSYACGVLLLNLRRPFKESFNTYKMFKGEDCCLQMLCYITEYCKDMNMNSIQVFAHNGGNFDTIFIRQIVDNRMKFVKRINQGGGSRIINQTIEFDKIRMTFKDSFAFISSSLAYACHDFKLEYQKTTMMREEKEKDIKLIEAGLEPIKKFRELRHDEITKSTIDEYQHQWEPYLHLDVLSLAELLWKVESIVSTSFGESITCNYTISSLANKIMRKSTPVSQVRICTDPVVDERIRAAVKGGRIFHSQKIPNENLTYHSVQYLFSTHYQELLKDPVKAAFIRDRENSRRFICLDANSLYPAAMYEGTYPLGEAMEHSNLSLLKEQLIQGTFQGRAICEVTMIAPPIYQPIHPIYHSTYGNYFPVGQFTDEMTDVDIQEAIRFGYRLIEIHHAFCWSRHSKLFDNLMDHLYNSRNQAKRAKNDALQMMLKILMNGMYGGLLLRPLKGEFRYALPKNDLVKSATKLGDQVEYKVECRPKYVAPAHLGAFVLAYSRVIMNRLIELLHAHELPGIMVYGDTDSVYVPYAVSILLNETNNLGDVKNDYGPGMFIDDYVFLGVKRYALHGTKDFPMHPTSNQKDISKYKFKFAGINYKSARHYMEDGLELNGIYVTNDLPFNEDMFNKFKGFVKEGQWHCHALQEIWKRTNTQVFIGTAALKVGTANADRRDFTTNEEISLPFFTDESKAIYGMNSVPIDMLKEIKVLPRRDYSMHRYRFTTRQWSQLFPMSVKGLGGNIIGRGARDESKFVCRTKRQLKGSTGLVKSSEIDGGENHNSIMKVHCRHMRYKDQERTDIHLLPMTPAGPMHISKTAIPTTVDDLSQYYRVLVTTIEYINNKVTSEDETAKKRLRRYLAMLQKACNVTKTDIKEAIEEHEDPDEEEKILQECGL